MSEKPNCKCRWHPDGHDYDCPVRWYDYAQSLQSEVERLRGRCGELESAATDKRIETLNSAFILRKQAEAVEAFAAELDSAGNVDERDKAEDYAQRLRQQADDMEAKP